MTARVAIVFCFLSVVLLIISVSSFGISPATPMILGVIVFFAVIFWTNAQKWVYLSSYLVCVVPSLLVLAITIYLKGRSPGDDLHYFDSRIILLGYSALPGLILSQRESKMLYSSLAVNFLCVALYDPVHNLFGAGYFQNGFQNPTYYHINTVSILVAAGIMGITVMLKRIVIFEEDKNAELSEEREMRNEELLAQNEEISVKSEQLARAFNLIDEQKTQLQAYTTQLEELVRLKSSDLSKSNEELQRYNSELLQFSYSVSHNLRGPVARLLGLTNLVNLDTAGMSEENTTILRYIRDSSVELDNVIRELSRIIDIRNELYTVKEKVFFEDQWEHVRRNLEGLIHSDMVIETDFSRAPHIYTIRPFLHSILYNLVSNAIRFRSPQRSLHVLVKSDISDGRISISVSDNGLGINLEQFSNNIFGMYKRFHTHVQGRGLGLFLVKTQAEALNGSARVESRLNVGTTFTIDIAIPTDIEGQVSFDCDYGSVLYNARIDAMGLLWKREVTSAEYRNLVTRCLELLHVYGTPCWISDLRKLEILIDEDYVWFSESVVPEAAQMGLRRIALVVSPGNSDELLKTAIPAAGAKYGIRIAFFESRSEAEAWIETA